MAASGRYARGSVVSALIMINLSSHTVFTAGRYVSSTYGIGASIWMLGSYSYIFEVLTFMPASSPLLSSL